MKFEVIRQIEKVEVIAVGTNIRNLAYLEKTMDLGDGESSRVGLMSGSPMETSDGLSCTGTKLMGLAVKISKLNVTWNETMIKHERHFAVCVDNGDYEASLILRKIYEIIPDEVAARDDFLRIVDESGEDYLYHKSHFIVMEFPAEVEHALLATQGIKV